MRLRDPIGPQTYIPIDVERRPGPLWCIARTPRLRGLTFHRSRSSTRGRHDLRREEVIPWSSAGTSKNDHSGKRTRGDPKPLVIHILRNPVVYGILLSTNSRQSTCPGKIDVPSKIEDFRYSLDPEDSSSRALNAGICRRIRAG